MCPKVIASLLYTISVYERFHRNALLLDGGGNLYHPLKQYLWCCLGVCYRRELGKSIQCENY